MADRSEKSCICLSLKSKLDHTTNLIAPQLFFTLNFHFVEDAYSKTFLCPTQFTWSNNKNKEKIKISKKWRYSID